MKKLVIGGYDQGKLHYVLAKEGKEGAVVFEAALPKEEKRGIRIINHFHLWVRSSLMAGKKPEEELGKWLRRNTDWIIISDEIGNGVVPMDTFERKYREETGRLLIKLAEEAEEVERILCGIGQRIK